MKELSIKEKAKAYDNIIEKANKMHCENCEACQICIEELIPELAESEDERIRKAMIDFFKHEREEGITVLHYGVNIECMIAWLEAQGEHAKFRDSIQVGDKVTRNQDGVLVNLSQLKRVAKKDEKQGEQNPDTDFSDLRTWKYIVDAVLTEKELIGQYRDRPFTEEVAKKLQKRFGKIEQKHEWSKEDKVMLDKVIERLHKYSAGDKEYLDIYYWLIALKDRVWSQPKQEWSEEDENIKESIITGLEMLKDGASDESLIALYNKKIDWLKSLKDRYTWKPSEEQIEALEHSLGDYNIKVFEDRYEILKSLYQDLKKIKGE